MPAKQSLAERYALSLSQTSATQNHHSDSISQILSDAKSPHSSPRIARSPRKSLAEKYQTQKAGKFTGRKVYGTSGSPIKRVSVSRQDASEIALPKLYKTTQSPELFARNKLFQQADANDYKVSKKQSSGARVARIARGITNFLGSMRRKTPETVSKNGHDGVQLSTRKNHGLGKDDGGLNPKNDTEFAELTRINTRKRVSEDTGEIDEVDLAIRENKHRQEKERLERQLSFEKRQIADLREEYEAQLHNLKEEIVYLKKTANDMEVARRQAEFKQRLAQREMESILEEKNRILADLDECKKSLFEKETLLVARGEELARKTENSSPRKEVLEEKKPSIPETALSTEPAIDNDSVTTNFEAKAGFNLEDFTDTSGEYSSSELFGVDTKKLDIEVLALYNSLVSTLSLLDHRGDGRDELEHKHMVMTQKLKYWITNVNGIPDPKYGGYTARIRDLLHRFDRVEPLLVTEPRRVAKLFNLEMLKKIKGSLEKVIDRFIKKSNALHEIKDRGFRECNETRGLKFTSPLEEISRYVDFLEDQVVSLWRIRECAGVIEDAQHALDVVERLEKAMRKSSEEKEGKA